MTSENGAVPVWARPPAGRRTTLSREAIVAAAVAVADAEGLAAVSIRRVAAELGARAMSLYTYIERKEDLLDLMADEVIAEAHVAEPLPSDWREATMTIARSERAAVRHHPWLVELISRREAVGPNGLRHLEQSVAALSGLGLDRAATLRILAAVGDYTRGFILREHNAADPRRTAAVDRYFKERVGTGAYPHLEPMFRDGVPEQEDTFEIGLTWLLNGIAAGLDREESP
ncbi:AcrR family transcriptional regulator [Thermocatellispora tengchongensis]|uniref:AcrR family transcriptional regulator n=1 Tax=Thermocatellispora tengchongensis TaxID=1073253 RepID=A0A840PB32_9ACTN|nr:TetR/AcrR family transcriptional regulator C-terminal domain-containing protein [Thermocatellispora tengchongensis]MBB5135071.1 AcrR family transcriptional regulator [Thermocatellispora tengchongensis]